MANRLFHRRIICLCAALLICGGAWAQDGEVSLGDVARGARQEQQRQKARGQSDAGIAANRMASQLSEQMEASGDAPVGYKFYVSPTRAYSVVLPEFAEPAGQDDGTVRVESGDFAFPMEIVLGAPIPARGETDRVRLMNGAKDFFGYCAAGAGSPGTLNGYVAAWTRATKCGFDGEGYADAVFVLAGDQVIPVLCRYHWSSWNFGKSGPTPRQMQKLNEDLEADQSMRQACDVVLNSVRPRNAGEWQQQSRMTRAAKPASAAAPATSGSGESLGEVARQTRRQNAQSQPALVIEDTEALRAGKDSKPYAFDYCLYESCYAASIMVPLAAELLPHTTFAQQLVFPVKGGYAAVEVETGQSSARGYEQTDTEYLDSLKGYPEGGYGTEIKDDWFDSYYGKTISTEDTTVAGYPARVTRSQTDKPSSRMQIAALIGAPGRAVVLRCSSPTAAYAEFEPVCLAIMDSLRVKQ